ncbi:hypothetical protein KA005_60450, partial [bacterium]|nr:hypothetical protein [bacterium]
WGLFINLTVLQSLRNQGLKEQRRFTMATVLFNPTDRLEEKFQGLFRGHYLGKGIGVKPGEKVKVPDATARHLLNELAPRGLISLDFGDEEEERAKEGLERNREFKVKQLRDFNEKNSARKHQGLPYLWPTKTLKLYAEEIGVKLVESYQVDDAQLQKVKTLETENQDLREQMKEMNEKMNQILEQMTRPEENTDKEEINKEIPEDQPKDEEVPTTKFGARDKRFK